MKPIYNSYKKTIILKSLNKTRVLFLIAIAATSLLVSCTADEIQVQPKNKSAKEVYLQSRDTILNVPNTTNTSSSGDIDPPPPVKGNNPPPPNP